MENLKLLLEYFGIETNEELFLKFGTEDIDEIIEDQNLVFDQIDECFIDSDYSIYCEKEGIITHEANTFYCEFSELHFTESNYNRINVAGFRNKNYISDYFKNSYSDFEIVQLFNGDLYNEEECRYVESVGEYYHEEDCYYWESDSEYHLEEEKEGCKIFSYHDSEVWFLADQNKPKIGFEIEKEDKDEKNSINCYQIQSDCGWGVERDGSLDSCSGFELISPCFNLHSEVDYFNAQFSKVANLINATYSDSCGGHINYSHPHYTSEDLLKSISGYIPLFYSLYTHRIEKSYCVAKSLQNLIGDREKFQSFNTKSNGVLEIRIFPAVKNTKNLFWRLELIQLIDLNKTSDILSVIDQMLDEKSPLHFHLLKIFTYSKIIEKVRGVIKYSKYFENLELSSSNLELIENKIINLQNKN